MKNRTVILAAGDFPSRGSEPERVLLSAERVVACDSAAASFRRRFRRWPDVVIGDFDSLGDEISNGGTKARRRCACEFVKVAEQETNDLDKAIRHCREKGWNDLVIVGATGLREDHTIGNVYRALAAEVSVVSEYGTFHPVRGKLALRVGKGAGVSVFAPDPTTKMTSRGLEWKLDGVKFENPFCATLNRASAETIAVTSDRPAFVYVARSKGTVRAVVSLGSNVGNRAAYLRRAVAALSRLPRTRLLDASAVRETEPVDVPREFAAQKFLNQAAVFETTLEPLAFSRAMHAIEDRLGRVRTVRNGPRTIDIDLILYGDVKMETQELTLPHPRAKLRRFVLEPLRELGVL
jgi:2-amino-4-hydroxy-6-hydroxymethyldihydropteridine diphosphokinase/thiamine pyrophosphokinase